jgi:hypothetical protein
MSLTTTTTTTNNNNNNIRLLMQSLDNKARIGPVPPPCCLVSPPCHPIPALCLCDEADDALDAVTAKPAAAETISDTTTVVADAYPLQAIVTTTTTTTTVTTTTTTPIAASAPTSSFARNRPLEVIVIGANPPAPTVALPLTLECPLETTVVAAPPAFQGKKLTKTERAAVHINARNYTAKHAAVRKARQLLAKKRLLEASEVAAQSASKAGITKAERAGRRKA